MKPTSSSTLQRVYAMQFAKLYPLYLAKVERKGRTQDELDTVLRWLTGYTPKKIASLCHSETDLETFFAKAPKLNPLRKLITGMICGIRVEDIKEPLMQEVRYMDKLVDELAKGKAMEKISRSREV